MNKWLLALCALSIVLLQARPASAAVNATFAITSPNPDIEFCPTNVNFSGSITGPAGTNVTYIFARFVNGAAIDSAPMNATIPANGILPITETLNIDKAHSGFQSNGLIVTAPNAAQGKVFFTVDCLIAIPVVVHPPAPPAPNSLTNTTDPPTCTNHAGFGGGLACLAGINAGMLALIWSSGGGANDGYKVYRVDGGQHTLIYTQANGKDVTLALVDKPSDSFNGKCYVVTAYRGKAESADSNFFCAGGYQGGPIVENFTVTPNDVRWVTHHYDFSQFAPGCGLEVSGTKPQTTFDVGFAHSYDTSAGFTCSVINLVFQTAVGFDLGPGGIVLRGSKASIKSATLSFQRTDPSNVSCLAGVHLPTVDWSNAHELVAHDDYRGNIPWGQPNQSVNTGVVKISGTNYSIDVASAVSDFAKGNRTNHGFLLVGGNEDTSGEDNNKCDSTFAGFVLNFSVVIGP